jgi:transcriptional regulator with XRE-family HTH domain
MATNRSRPPSPERTELATRIRDARNAAGLTQQALGALVGVSGVTIAFYETSRSAPRAERLAALSAALGVVL